MSIDSFYCTVVCVFEFNREQLENYLIQNHSNYVKNKKTKEKFTIDEMKAFIDENKGTNGNIVLHFAINVLNFFHCS